MEDHCWLTHHDRMDRTEALRLADHPFKIDKRGWFCPGGYLTVYRAGGSDTAPIGFAVRLQNGWMDPCRWRAVLTAEDEEREIGNRQEHRCAEDAERAIMREWRSMTDESCGAGENIVWLDTPSYR